MKAPRIYLPLPLVQGASVTLDARAARHVKRVLRLRTGNPLILFNGQGHEWHARLTQTTGPAPQAEVVDVLESGERESPLDIMLMQGISRGERMDYTLQKAVELGVKQIWPIWTERSQLKLSGERLARRMQHWQGIIIHACEQSGRNVIPPLIPPETLHESLSQVRTSALCLVLEPSGDYRLSDLDQSPASVTILAGPEGGLTASETLYAQNSGFLPLRLGPRILRTETAGLAAMAALQLQWGDFR
jgi:16S rRNA (uracil1498-N3)-methyltransferase